MKNKSSCTTCNGPIVYSFCFVCGDGRVQVYFEQLTDHVSEHQTLLHNDQAFFKAVKTKRFDIVNEYPVLYQRNLRRISIKRALPRHHLELDEEVPMKEKTQEQDVPQTSDLPSLRMKKTVNIGGFNVEEVELETRGNTMKECLASMNWLLQKSKDVELKAKKEHTR